FVFYCGVLYLYFFPTRRSSDLASTLMPSIIETSVAIMLFFITPAVWFKQLAKYVPGTVEHSNEQEQYLQKVRNVTAKRVEQFSRSEEHTSELQSRFDLVCRLLL